MATESSPQPAERAELNDQFITRIRQVLWAMLAAIPLFAFADVFLDRVHLSSLYLVKLLGLALIGVGFLALHLPRVREQPAVLALLIHFWGCLLTSVSGIVSLDSLTTPLLCTSVTLIAAIFFPWGESAQLVAVVNATLAMLLNSYVLGGSFAEIASYPAAAVGIAMAASVVAAGDVRRYRSAVAAQSLERRRAENAAAEETAIAAAMALLGRELIETSALHPRDLLDRLCRTTAELMRCDTSYTLLWDETAGAFSVVAGFGGTAEELEWARVVALPRSSVEDLLARLSNDDIAEVASGHHPPNSHSVYVCMALRRGGEIIGLQTAGLREAGRAFGSRQLRIGRGIAQLASLTLQNVKLLDELERANELKSEFVATMSHELRTPLNVIIGYTDLIREELFGPLTPEQADGIARVRVNAGQLLELINMTLDLSRLDGGGIPVALADVDLPAFMAALERECREQKKDGVEMAWDVEPDLPTLHTDATQLKVILKNLIANALKFTEKGRVTISVVNLCDLIQFEVADTGVGVAPEAQEVIFEPFRQAAPSVSAHFGGAGLGLHIVRRLADLLGASVSVESTLGVGSTFRVRMPPKSAQHRRGKADVIDISLPRGLRAQRQARASPSPEKVANG